MLTWKHSVYIAFSISGNLWTSIAVFYSIHCCIDICWCLGCSNYRPNDCTIFTGLQNYAEIFCNSISADFLQITTGPHTRGLFRCQFRQRLSPHYQNNGKQWVNLWVKLYSLHLLPSAANKQLTTKINLNPKLITFIFFLLLFFFLIFLDFPAITQLLILVEMLLLSLLASRIYKIPIKGTEPF